MSKIPVAYHADDISRLARKLRQQLLQSKAVPSHLEILNILARATGYRNFQHFRARDSQHIAEKTKISASERRQMERLARCFDREGRLLRWPSRRADQILSLWILWLTLPDGIEFSERSISSWLRKRHGFGDHALLRRELCALNLVSRTIDGSVYRRIDRQDIPAEVGHLRTALGMPFV